MNKTEESYRLRITLPDGRQFFYGKEYISQAKLEASHEASTGLTVAESWSHASKIEVVKLVKTIEEHTVCTIEPAKP